MKLLCRALLPILVFATAVAHGQSSWSRYMGNMISDALMMRLTNPRLTSFRVGISNTALDTGMLISGKDSRPVVEFVRGYSSERGHNWQLAWSAAEQAETAVSEGFRFELIRTRVDSQNCPALEDAIEIFYSELETAITGAAISLLRNPEPSQQLRVVTVDGTTYPIQVWTGREGITLTADRDVNKSLHAASQSLHGAVSGCSNDVAGKIEQHVF